MGVSVGLELVCGKTAWSLFESVLSGGGWGREDWSMYVGVSVGWGLG